ncbi:carbohydrate esterase family 4 protein [Botryobasidium botryosum FD-172 SS1]|uniref:Carbohydrate esterase family 4 protein n=1 Tax=Botryobasidium botryosum (strain FD-172 SS1) TaxID=930990 RepID=A0A067MNK6_BOTB1|nr:carbohydrate esterase family 4 protein [Botryobasidium botryosum FD-172 SS1]
MKVSTRAYFAATLAVASAAVLPRQDLGAGLNAVTSCTMPNTIALTFDDGPYTWHQKIVDMLEEAGGKGTFFVNGNNYECIYDEDSVTRLQYSYGKGHQIGSHTWRHADLSTLSGDELDTEFTLTDTALGKILGVVPTFMRPPYGSYNDETLQVAANHKQNVIIWDFEDGDSTGSTAEQSKQDYDTLFAKNPSNILTLNHETYQTTAEQVLPYVLNILKNKNYKLVTVAECLGITEIYQDMSTPGTRDDTWACDGTPSPGN